jgi:anti-anti-sigma factor
MSPGGAFFRYNAPLMARPFLQIFPANGSRPGRRVLRLSGRLGIETVPSFLAAARAESATTLILDLGDVEYLDSSGVGALLQIHVSLAKGNRQLVLASVPEKVRMVLEIARLQSIFPMYSSVAIAEELLP